MRRLPPFLAAALLAACSVTPPAPAPARSALPILAGFDATWDAAIDHFAQNAIPIATIEKVSGIIVASRLAVPRVPALEYADCGSNDGIIPLQAMYDRRYSTGPLTPALR